MALPTTISGIGVYNNTAVVSKPFLSSGGNVYVVGGLDSPNTAQIGAFKATDPTSSFSGVGTNFTPHAAWTIRALAAYQVGDNIHVVSLTESANVCDVHYHIFSMSSDSWTTTSEAVVTGFNVTNARAYSVLGIIVRSDGDVIVFHPGEDAAVMGTSYDRVVYSRKESGSWTTNVAVDNAGAESWVVSDMVIGASDRAHMFFQTIIADDGYQRTLTSANALESFPSAYDTALNASDRFQGGGTSYTSGGTVKVRIPSADSTTTDVASVKLDSSDAPTVTQDTDITGTTSRNDSQTNSAFAADGTTLWHVFSDSTNRNIYTQSNANDGGWSAPSLFYDDAAIVVGHKCNVYTRGTSVVLAIVYGAGTTAVKYHEKVLSTTGVTATANITLGAATVSSAGEVDTGGALNKTLGALASSSDVDVFVVGELSKTLGTLTLSATLVPGEATGSADITLGVATVSSEAVAIVGSVLSATLGALTASSEAVAIVGAELSKTLGALTSSSAGKVDVAGDGSITLAGVGTNLSGSVSVVAESSTVLGSLILSSDGSLAAIQVDLDVTLGAATVAADGSVESHGSASIALSSVLISSDGTVESHADSSIGLGAATLASTGAILVQGDVSVTLGAASLSSSGTVGSTPANAELSVTLGGVTMSSDADVLVLASSSNALGAAGVSADGVVQVSGSYSVQLASLLVSSAVGVDVVGDLAVSLSNMTVTSRAGEEILMTGLEAFVSDYTGTTYDRLKQLLLANGATGGAINDMWIQFFDNLGFTSGSVDDRMRAFLLDYTAAADTGQTIQDLWSLVTGPYAANPPYLIDSIASLQANVYTAHSFRCLSIDGGTETSFRGYNEISANEADIGFKADRYSLDTEAILTLGAGNNVLVKTWYSQSGLNKNPTQATVANMPRISLAGTIDTAPNGRPCMVLADTTDILAYAADEPMVSIFAVASQDFVDGDPYQSLLIDNLANTRLIMGGSSVQGVSLMTGGIVRIQSSFEDTDLHVISLIITGGNAVLHVDNALMGQFAVASLAFKYIGYILTGKVCELVTASADLSADRVEITQNMADYWGITL